jgi:hypothetical protein
MQAPFIPAIVGRGAVRTALSISFSGTKNARADEASIARNAETSMPAEKARPPPSLLSSCLVHKVDAGDDSPTHVDYAAQGHSNNSRMIAI